jgi:predicted dienelactone hydrolase
MKKTSLILILAILSVNALTVHAQQVAQCTGLKATTLPLSGDYGGFGAFAVTRQTIPNPDPTAPAPVSVFVPSNATAQNKVPVVFFAHGFGGTSYVFYEKLLQQLASNGYIVVYLALHLEFICDAHPSLQSTLERFSRRRPAERPRLWTRPKSVSPDILTAQARRRKWRGAASRRLGRKRFVYVHNGSLV